MRELIIDWIDEHDFYYVYPREQLDKMSDDELMVALDLVVKNLCEDS